MEVKDDIECGTVNKRDTPAEIAKMRLYVMHACKQDSRKGMLISLHSMTNLMEIEGREYR